MGQVLLVTGATGRKSGGAFAERLAENWQTIRERFPGGVRLLVRPVTASSPAGARLHTLLPEAELCTGELQDAGFLRGSMKNVDTVVHVAGIHTSRNVVDAAASQGVRRLILVHTTGIYSKYKEAGEAYRQTDHYVTEVCQRHHILLTILRPTMIYGNVYDNNVITFIKMVDRLPVMPVVNGARYALQPVHYTDLAKAYYGVLLHEPETAGRNFNLSGGTPLTLREMLEIIGQNLGKKVRFVSCPFPIAYAGAWLVYGCTLGRMDYRERVQRLCEPRTFPHEEAEAAFGYQPMGFAEGIRGEVREYLALKQKR